MIADYFQLLRMRQWYKNVVVFLALFFSGKFFNPGDMYFTTLAFFSLMFISSSNYIINDIRDLSKDKNHPDKKLRPLAAGKIKIPVAIIIALLSIAVGIGLALLVNPFFLYLAVVFFILTQLYTFFLKEIVIVDLLTIATLFVLRAISGAFAIKVQISPWLVLCPFFLSFFLSVGKRYADLRLLKEKAMMTRKVLQEYTLELTDSLMLISTTLLLVSYSLYSFLSEHANLIYTLPFALFVIFRYYYLIKSNSLIARQPERVITDRQMAIGILLWAAITALVIYFPFSR